MDMIINLLLALVGLLRRRQQTREIFRYWDGVRERGIDPIWALRELYADEKFVPDRHFDAAMDGNEESMVITLAAMKRVFGLEEWTEAGQRGLLQAEVLRLGQDFASYIEAVKKNGSGRPISPDATEPNPSDPSTMSADSASTSTGTEQRHAEHSVS